MRSPAVRPRPDQVAELTRGVRLPLPPIAEVHLEVLAEGLGEAFDDLRVRQPVAVASGSEPEATALMEACLNRRIEEDSLWGQLVLWVARGKEGISFDGSHLEKRPDLSIHLWDGARRFPLVVEAKIVDSGSEKTVARYCYRGLRRFVEGEYAWGNREALMIAYVRDGSSIAGRLKPFLAEAMGSSSPAYLVEELPAHVGSSGRDLACSRHSRAFVYVTQIPPNHAGPISIWHLWLS